MKRFRPFLIFMLILMYTGCDENAEVSTGPSLGAGLISIGLSFNTNGTVTLNTNYHIPLAEMMGIGIGWNISKSIVLNRAKQTSNSLFILWEDEAGKIWQQRYDVGQSFSVQFERKDWVKEISNDDQGNIFVSVLPQRGAPGYNDLNIEIQDLIKRWDAAHVRADQKWDTSALSTVLRDSALQQQLSVVKTLRSKNCYWDIYERIAPQISLLEEKSPDFLIVEVYKDWDMNQYCNGRKTADEDGSFTVRYTIEKVDGNWYITNKTQIK